MDKSSEILKNGASLLVSFLEGYGFVYQPSNGDFRGSGGSFSTVSFIKKYQRIELWYRFSLNVSYSVQGLKFSHIDFMKALGKDKEYKYPSMVYLLFG